MATILIKTGLIPFLLSLIVTFLLAPPPALSQTFCFEFDGEKPDDLDLQGDTHFPTDPPFLRLTKTNATGYPLPHSDGRAIYRQPINFWEPEAQLQFDTTIKFIISKVDDQPADGLTFFIAPAGYSPNDLTGGSLGIFSSEANNPSVFAVEFDTYINAFDPDYRHVGIDIQSPNSVITTRVNDAILDKLVTANIKYDVAAKLIHVSVDTQGPRPYEISYPFNLRTVLNERVEVGLSGSTGYDVAIHDVTSWCFSGKLVYDETGPKKKDIKIQQYV